MHGENIRQLASIGKEDLESQHRIAMNESSEIKPKQKHGNTKKEKK
jgi:hypothetical protein